MKKLEVIAIDSYRLDGKKNSIPEHLMTKLYRFLAKSYHLANEEELKDLFSHQTGSNAELTVLYGMNEQIAGCLHSSKQVINTENKHVTAYVAYIYLNPDYKAHPNSANTGLTQAIKDKMACPEEELVYIAVANNPLAYEFIAALSDSIFPKPADQVPEDVLNLINKIKQQNGWLATTSHPMVVSSSLVPIRSQTPNFYDEGSDLSEFYLATNPDYMQGNSLLVYMPLNLVNINYCDMNYDKEKSFPQQYPDLGHLSQ